MGESISQPEVLQLGSFRNNGGLSLRVLVCFRVTVTNGIFTGRCVYIRKKTIVLLSLLVFHL